MCQNAFNDILLIISIRINLKDILTIIFVKINPFIKYLLEYILIIFY